MGIGQLDITLNNLMTKSTWLCHFLQRKSCENSIEMLYQIKNERTCNTNICMGTSSRSLRVLKLLALFLN